MNELKQASGPALVFLIQIYSIILPMQFVGSLLPLTGSGRCAANMFHGATTCAGSR